MMVIFGWGIEGCNTVTLQFYGKKHDVKEQGFQK